LDPQDQQRFEADFAGHRNATEQQHLSQRQPLPFQSITAQTRARAHHCSSLKSRGTKTSSAKRAHNLARINLVHARSKNFAYILLRNVIVIAVEASV
jgi:hypothetical protein